MEGIDDEAEWRATHAALKAVYPAAPAGGEQLTLARTSAHPNTKNPKSNNIALTKKMHHPPPPVSVDGSVEEV